MNTVTAPNLALVADVGGTNTRVALAEGLQILPDTIRKYPNSDHDGLEAVLRQFVSDEGSVSCASACVAVAGPVQDGVAELTNVDWFIDSETLIRATGTRQVAILNDLQAQAHALPYIDPANIKPVIRRNVAGPGNTMLVIGVGTGMNAATAIDAPHGRFVPPSETGHSGLPIRTEAEARFAIYVEKLHGFASIEDALSGTGLENIYRWLGHEAGDEKHLGASEIMAGLADGSDARAEQAARLFTGFLGATAGNLALIQLPFGGIYLIGGVARAMTPYLSDFGFAEAFHDKGRLSDFIGQFSVSVIEDDFAALTGCASHLVDLARAT